MSSIAKKDFIFLPVHEASRNPRRDRLLDSRVRRHLMSDIGRSRRKPAKASPFVTLEWQVEDAQTKSASDQEKRITSSREKFSTVIPSAPAHASTPALMSAPVVRMLSVFEKEWGEDWFSAYGFSLLMLSGQSAASHSIAHKRLRDPYWFPFAFSNSPFMQHYRSLFNSPSTLVSLFQGCAKELRVLALDRSLVTIRCIESTLASFDDNNFTSKRLVNGILALICYNFTSFDFAQARVHLKGVQKIVAAAGGISALDATGDLLLMISSIDITAALLWDTKPLFSLPLAMGSSTTPSLETLPVPLRSLAVSDCMQDSRFVEILSGMSMLNELHKLLDGELTSRGNAIWLQHERIDGLVNPVAHHFLNNRVTKSPVSLTREDVLAEALRLGALLWIIEVKRRCHSYPGKTGAYVSVLLDMLSDQDLEPLWNFAELRPVRLWLLVLCGISEPGEDRFVAAMRLIAGDAGLEKDWGEIMVDVHQMPWLDVFESQCAEMRRHILK